MVKKISIRNGENFMKSKGNLKPGYNSKKKEEEQLFQILKADDTDDTDEELLFFEMFKDFYKSIDKAIEKLEVLVINPLNPPEKAKLEKILIEDLDKLENIPSIIKFFEDNKLLKNLSFEAVLNLISYNLNENELKNLIKIADADYQREEALNLILESAGDKIIFSDNITNKIIKLKEIETHHEGYYEFIDFLPEDYILLKDVKLSEQLIEKIELIIECGVNISIKDFKDLDKLEIDKTIVNKLKKLGNDINVYFEDLPIIEKIDFNRNLLKNIDSLNKLGFTRLYGKDLLKIQNLTKRDIETLEHINKLGGKDKDIDGVFFVLKLKISEIDKIIGDIKKLGLDVSCSIFEIFYKIPEDVLQYCIKNNIKDISDIKNVKAMYSISNRKSMRNYINRKNEYLGKNRTLSEEKYIKYFGGKGKFGKHEINQGDIGLCYLYSGLEILKKMNGFPELIQSNFIEKEDGWLVRFPFNVGSWIKVNKDEIDRKYEVRKDGGKIRKMNINSRSEYLGFKILEIAYIKNELINRLGLDWEEGDGKENNPLDILLSGENLEKVEGGNTILTLQELLSKENIVIGRIAGYNPAIRMYKSLKEIGAPENIIKSEEKRKKEKDKRIDFLFHLYKTGFISIELSSRQNFSSLGEWMKKIEGKKTYFLVSGIEIVDKYGQKISQEKLYNIRDLEVDEGGNINVKFFTNHAYSVEKCYVDENGEKKVRVVNPHHTGIKFDMSLEKCKSLFEWMFGVINIDKLFT